MNKRCRRAIDRWAAGAVMTTLAAAAAMLASTPGITHARAHNATASEIHPQDGAHADIRIAVFSGAESDAPADGGVGTTSDGAGNPSGAIAASGESGSDGMGGGGVRFDILTNLLFADYIAWRPREALMEIDPAEEPALRDALTAFFTAGEDSATGEASRAGLDGPDAALRVTKTRVLIDGVEVTPVVKAFSVMRPGPELLPLFPLSGNRGLIRIRLVLEYSAKQRARSVSLQWGTFPPDLLIRDVAPGAAHPPAAVECQLTTEGKVSIVRFTASEPEHVVHLTGLSLAQRFETVPDFSGTANAADPTAGGAPGGTGDRTSSGQTGSGIMPGGRWRTIAVAAGVGGVGLVCCVGMVRAMGWRRARGRCAVLVAACAGLSVLLSMPKAGSPVSTDTRADRLPTTEEALAVFRPLHANIYRAFDYQKESDIYDALSRSVDGRLLDALYNEVYRSLVLQEEGGAVCTVQEVRPMEAEVVEIGMFDAENVAASGGGALIARDERRADAATHAAPSGIDAGRGSAAAARGGNGRGEESAPGFRVRTRWQVDGSVYHWGHSHERTNEYAAEYVVVRRAAGWRIASSQTIEQRRIDTGTPQQPAELPDESDL